MRFDPKTDEELSSGSVWPDGTYDFEVSNAEETTSKAGNDMVKLTIFIFNAAGARWTIFDYLVGSPKAVFKVKQFAEAVGLRDAYDRGELDAVDMIGKTGQCKVVTIKSDGFADKNGIGSYLKARGSVSRPAAQRQKVAAGDLDDEIPF